ncbi:MAG: copper ion binding protein [Candidatus Aenigmarchaeota archaeon]|nr:copper ion binding protein [Candidatus Aenigmarchaeota archaeon]
MKNQKKLIKIKGMHCNSCVKNIESTVSKLSGVKRVKVDLKKESAEVVYDQNKINFEEINKKITSLGYCVCGKTPCVCNSHSIKQGIIYGVIPHLGCIAFVIASIVGSTFFVNIFKPLLMNPYFFYILIGMSLIFATASSLIYLKNNGFLSFDGIKRKWKYLTVMYGSTLGVNVLFFFFIFPLLTNISTASASEYSSYPSFKISVDIPCSGHAPLITEELKSLDGVENVKFEFPNYFYISYDQAKISKSDILSIEVFKTYAATEVVSSQTQNNINSMNNQNACGMSSCGCNIR